MKKMNVYKGDKCRWKKWVWSKEMRRRMKTKKK